jgi:hypothetical protein
VTKCRILAAGIGAGGAFFFAVGLATNGVARMLAWYVTLACTLSAFAYLTNRPGIYGKSDGRLVPWRAVATLPFLVAYGIAALIRTSMRSYATWNEVEPGLFVGGRVPAAELPPGIARVVDFTSEISAPADVRCHSGYRSHPVLDGGWPPDETSFTALVRELAGESGPLYLHCISGRGRAPTAAAAVLLARGTAGDVATAVELVKKGRPATALTHTDLAFLERVAPQLTGP